MENRSLEGNALLVARHRVVNTTHCSTENASDGTENFRRSGRGTADGELAAELLHAVERHAVDHVLEPADDLVYLSR